MEPIQHAIDSSETARPHFDDRLTLPDDEQLAILAVATAFGAEALDFGRISESQMSEFWSANSRKLRNRALLVALLEAVGQTPTNRYELEYGSWSCPAFREGVSSWSSGGKGEQELALDFCTPNYQFWCPLLEASRLVQIVNPATLPNSGLTVDVGCGDGALLSVVRDQLGVTADQLLGLDISTAAIADLRRKGIPGRVSTLVGALSGKELEAESVRLLLLSYFVDRDNAQRATFESAAKVTLPGGRLVLEGLFPVRAADSLGTQYADQATSVTNGESAADDVLRVVQCLSGFGFQLECLAVGERLVFSLDGFERLSSCLIVMRKL